MIKKAKPSDAFLNSLIEQACPLMLVDEEGKARISVSKNNCYLTVMQEIYKAFPKGYVECEMLISNLLGINYKVAGKIYHLLFNVDVINSPCLVELWDRKSKTFFREFIRGLHNFAGTEFDTYAFDSAFTNYMVWVEREKLIEEFESKRDENKK